MTAKLQPSRATNPATAMIAALLGLAAAAGLVVLGVEPIRNLPEGAGFGDLRGEAQTIVIACIAAAALLLIGVIVVFARKPVGVIVLVLGALAGIAALLLFPVLLDIPFGTYLEGLYTFADMATTFAAIALIAAPLALIFAILPPTLHHLKGSRAADDSGDPQQSW